MSAQAPERWAVVGGGMLGCTLALRLAEQGKQVTLLEAAPEIGGLASAWTIDSADGPITWDRHYHVSLLSDLVLRNVLTDLGLESDIEWVETKTGYYANGTLSSVSSSLDFLRLPSLSMVAKSRLAATILCGSRMQDWEKLEQIPVSEWLTRWSGAATFEKFWLPLLRAKLGESWPDASASFIWATIQRLYAARRSGLKKEMFGYVPGGYAHILERFAAVLESRGVSVRTGVPVEQIEADPAGGLHVTVAGEGGDAGSGAGNGAEVAHFDQVVVTSNPNIADRISVGLSDDERERLLGVRYQGIVCASVVLRRPLSPYYLTYLLDEMPFTAVVEMTAFVDPKEVGGHTLVYLPKYVAPDDPLFDVSDADLRERFLEALMKIYPDLTRSDVLAFKVSRVRRVFPIPTLGYSTRLPRMTASVPGLHFVSSAQIVNGTLNVNETVQLAEQAARLLSPRSALGTASRGKCVSSMRAEER